MKSTVTFVILLLFVSGCSQKDPGKTLRLKEELLTYENSFPAYNLAHFTNSDNQEFLSFADFVTHKQILFHALDGSKKWSVDVKPLMNREKEKFICYHIISADSILLLTKYSNKLYLIDRNATILKKFDYSGLLARGIEFAPLIYSENKFIYLTLNHYPVRRLNTPNDINEWSAQAMRQEQIGRLEIGKDDQTIAYFGKNLINRFLASEDIDAQGTYYVVNREKIYYFSPYTDTLYAIHENKTEPLVKITSQIGKIHVTPSTREQYNRDADCINKAYVQQAFICEVLFDNYSERIYVIVRKPKVDDYFPFHVLVYDTHFKQLEELKFDGMKHLPTGFVGKKGLYLLRNYDKNPNQKSFDLLTYEK